MAKISAIKAQTRDPNRVNIFLDGGYAFSVARIVAAWLTVGQELSQERITSLQQADIDEKAYQEALHFLSYRMRSTREIEHYLRQNGYSEEIVSVVTERLERSGILNDTAFANSWVENRDTFRPRSRRLLSMELRQKGIPEEVIELSLTEAPSDEELAYQAALKQARKLEHMERLEFRRKLSGFLARRGFSYDTISPVVDRVWADLHSTGELSR